MFTDRADAGRRLAPLVRAALADIVDGPAPIVVVGLPAAGCRSPSRWHVRSMRPCDVIVVRKVGVPGHRELAMGAIGEGGVTVRNDDVIRSQRVTPEQFAEAERGERVELARRSQVLRSGRASHPLGGHVVVVVDDGLATGATARAACEVARAAGAAGVVLAVPVAPAGFDRDLGAAADRYVAVDTPQLFRAVGEHYRHFDAVGERDVVAMLERVWSEAPGHHEPDQRDR